MGTTTAICLLGLWLPVSHFAHALNLVPLPHEYLLALVAILAAYLLLTQLVKTWLIKRFGLN
jgi:Mg2+-importing ATPase